MIAQKLRSVSNLAARASRLLGRGLELDFKARGLGGSIRLEPSEHGIGSGDESVLLESAIGPLRLSDAGAVLSLLGNLPVVVQGSYQAWYWQLINQQLSTPIKALLAPIAPIMEGVTGSETEIVCRLQVRLGEECVHAIFSTSPASLLRLLEGAPWQAEEHYLGDDWDVSQPLVIGKVALTVEQFESLRPGDILLPAISYFDIDGEGRLDVGGRHWSVAAEPNATRIVVRLTHEETL